MKTYLITLGIALPIAILGAGFDIVSATVAMGIYIVLIALVGAAGVLNAEAAAGRDTSTPTQDGRAKIVIPVRR